MDQQASRKSEYMEELKKTWKIAAPSILTSVAQFSIDLVTMAFVGHLGTVELAAVSIVQNLLECFVYGIMLGMGSALETLCGQAVGAGQLRMLGIYMQRSWIISGITAVLLIPFYIFATPMLKLLRQDDHIAELAGKFSLWVLPQLFAYALNFPTQKFLQSQSKVWVVTLISVLSLIPHTSLSWLLVTKLDLGLLGATMAANVTWWLIVTAQIIYVVAGYFPEAWTGLSLQAFHSLWGFVKLSVSSAIMSCLELWYFSAVILMVGRLKNPEIAVDTFSICMNLEGWALMVALGFNAAASVRVSNELGAANAKGAKLSTIVSLVSSTAIGIFFTVVVFATKNQLPKIFSKKIEVIRETSKLGYLLAVAILLNGIQPVLQGVAVGAGWQSLVALVNIGCYYIIGLPIGALLGYKMKLGLSGVWIGMLTGCLMQTLILLLIVFRKNWQKEAMRAEVRIRTLGGSSSPEPRHALTKLTT